MNSTDRTEGYGGHVAAVPLACAVVIWLARALPVEFSYHPNELGIISAVTRLEYPKQQESFWLFFGVGVGLLAIWAIARFLRGRSFSAKTVVAVESLGAATLASVLFLPTIPAAVVGVAAVAAVFAIAARRKRIEGHTEPVAAVAEAKTGNAVWWIPIFVGLALLLSPNLPVHVWNVTQAVPDAELTHDNFKFLAETGQHLAWANSLTHGGLHGRDFFCLYGPFYDLGIVGFWSALGKSVAATGFYLACSRVVAWVCFFAAIAMLVRRRPLLLLTPFLIPYVKLRVGLALLAFLFYALWLRGDRRGWVALSGAIAGVSLLFSQEYGIAFALAAVAGFAIRRDGVAALFFFGGLASVAAPVLGYYAAHGALLPMLHDVASYPRYVMAGYANFPFPSLLSALPLDLGEFGTRPSTYSRLGYAVPAVCVAGMALAFDVGRLDWRRPLVSIREATAALGADPMRLSAFLIAAFGLISFRSALGRSDLSHLQATIPGAIVVLCVAFDRALVGIRAGDPRRPIAVFRVAALAAFVVLGGFTDAPTPLSHALKSVSSTSDLVRFGHNPAGSRRIVRVVRWVQLNTAPEEPVLFLPNDAAYYYLTDRPNPIRFVLGHQIVGDDHRREVLADLENAPPRYIIWDHDALVVDDIAHAEVFGPEIQAFFASNYETEGRLGTVEILRRTGTPAGRP